MIKLWGLKNKQTNVPFPPSLFSQMSICCREGIVKGKGGRVKNKALLIEITQPNITDRQKSQER